MSHNVVVLKGWLEIDQVLSVLDTPMIRAWLYTDKARTGGKHAVLLCDRAAAALQEWAQQAGPGAGLPQVTLLGKLVSHGESSLMLAKTLHLEGAGNIELCWVLSRLAALGQKTNDPAFLADLNHLLEQGSRLLSGRPLPEDKAP